MKLPIALTGAVTFLLLSAGLYAQDTELSHGLDGSNPNTSVVAGRTDNPSIGNVNASALFNGSHNVYIPIYNFENSYGHYGVGLSYNTKGVKVNEVATEVGLHWNLAAGGSIVRQVKDIPDDILRTWITPPTDLYGTTMKEYVGKMGYNMNPAYRSEYNLATMDLEHDDFMVSVGDLSFTFNIGDGGTLFTHPHKHVKVEILNGNTVIAVNSFPNLMDNKQLGFRITDDKGIVYVFKPHNYQTWIEPRFYIETDAGSANHVNAIVSAWGVESITFPDGSLISYHYGSSKGISTVHSIYSFRGGTNVLIRAPFESASRKPLEKIVYPNNEVVRFAYMENTCTYTHYILDTIYVEEGQRSLKYVLQHDIEAAIGYTNKFDKRAVCQSLTAVPTGFTRPDYYRLFLKGIELYGMEGGLSETLYNFKYHAQKLPAYQSGKQDFMGYFNNASGSIADNGKSTMPTHEKISGGSTYTGTNRSYSGVHAQAGLLIEMQNSYGGVTRYTYEGHSGLTTDLLDYAGSGYLANSSDLADGVRIRRIEQADPTAPEMSTVTEFTYEGGQQFTPQGSIATAVQYNSDGSVRNYQYFGHITSPLLLVNGSNVGYSKVTAVTRNNASQQLSKTVSYFTNLSDHLSPASAKYIKVGSDRDYFRIPVIERQYLKSWEIGLEYKTETFDHANNITGMTEHFFTFVLDTLSAAGHVENIKSAWAQNTKGDSFHYYTRHIFDGYRPFSGKVLLQRTESRKYYSNTNFITDKIYYTYNDRDKIHATETENSEGKKFITYNIYSSDMGLSVPDALLFAYPLNVKVAQEKWSLDNHKDPASMYLLESAVFFHEKASGKLRSSRRSYISRFSSPIRDDIFTGYKFSNTHLFTANRYNYIKNAYSTGTTPSGFELLSSVNLYDTSQLALDVSGLNNIKTNAIIYDPISHKTLATAVNAAYDQVGFTGFDESIKTGDDRRFSHTTLLVAGNFSYSGHGWHDGSGTFGTDYICAAYYKLRVTLSLGATEQPTLRYLNTLQAGQKYILEFWSKGGTPTLVGSGLTSVTFEPRYQVGGWTYYTAVLTPTANTGLTIKDNAGSSTGVMIDEVRIHPQRARMTTTTYAPIVGIIAEAESLGRQTYYEYDDLGRLMLVRDQEGHILKMYERQ